MGACASVPKGFKSGAADAAPAPPPEQPKEETATAEAPPEASGVKAEEGEKEAVESNIDDKSKNDGEVVAVKDDAKLADDQGETKADSTASTGGAEAVTPPVKEEEDKKVEQASPVYDSPPPKEDDEKKSSTKEVAKGEMTIEETLSGR